MFIIKYRKIFYILSTILVVSSIAFVAMWGIKFGIDFAGGSVLEVKFLEQNPENLQVENVIENIGLEKDFSVRETDNNGFILRSTTITDVQKNQVLASLQEQYGQVSEIRFNTIGPVLGKELTSRALLAVFVVVLSIVLYVAYAFRHVSKPVSSWKYGLVTIISFVHDVSVPIGVFAILGRFYGVEVDTLFIIALLVVLGYSINDTIVVFDRIRDNLKDVPDKQKLNKFEEIVGKSLMQTFGRSINTSFTTLITLTTLFFVGSESTKWFSLALIVGITAGTYSSIFFASPMLVSLSKFAKKAE